MQLNEKEVYAVAAEVQGKVYKKLFPEYSATEEAKIRQFEEAPETIRIREFAAEFPEYESKVDSILSLIRNKFKALYKAPTIEEVPYNWTPGQHAIVSVIYANQKSYSSLNDLKEFLIKHFTETEE